MRVDGRQLALLGALVAAWLLSGRAWAAETPPADEPIAGWVRALGSPKYAERERAARQLKLAGMRARRSLISALGSRDAEVRRRASQILVEVLDKDFRARIRAFNESSDPNESFELPCWPEFRALAGSGVSSRRLFVEMLRDEGPLLEAFAESPADAVRVMESRLGAPHDGVELDFDDDEDYFSTGRMAAYLFVAQDERVTLDESRGFQLSSLLFDVTLGRSLSGGTSEPLKALMTRWLTRPCSETLCSQNLYVALHSGLAASLELGQRILAGESPAEPELRAMALLAVARYGSREQLPLVERSLGDKSVCSVFEEGEGEATGTVGDAALLAAILLTGQEVEPYGFMSLSPDVDTAYEPNSIGFPDEASREKAHQRWKDWRSKQAPD